MFRNLFWHRFPKSQPTKDGWYQCTINFEFSRKFIGNDEMILYQEYVMDLYWYNKSRSFIDNRAKQVIETYEVIGYGKNSEKHRISLEEFNHSIDRTKSVIAWRKMPKTYRIRNRQFNK